MQIARGGLEPAEIPDCVGGLERTEAQFRSLIEANGFKFRRTLRTPNGLCILEAESC